MRPIFKKLRPSDPEKALTFLAIALKALDPQAGLPKGVAVGTYRLTMPMPVPDEATAREPELLTPPFRVQVASSQ